MSERRRVTPFALFVFCKEEACKSEPLVNRDELRSRKVWKVGWKFRAGWSSVHMCPSQLFRRIGDGSVVSRSPKDWLRL
jgi:hypothetical protein